MSDLIASLYNFDKTLTPGSKLLRVGRTKIAKDIPLAGPALEKLRVVYREVDDALTEASTRLPEFHR
ncbi:MAG: hypothetical protein DRH15_06200 [Deltaproteobacteria bacterium]|nr:hypothetical protein [Deltaproteobacteria bacterium]MBW2082132.1 hypothetical protein [Deltaproteobacteria bacterium]RLB82180.1 MAG: hypothetical protein DRH15_06200 [Deltaproteobacteria bacterium]HDM10048.1 hypothetical protein [Desulfobacteraceae bacterium]